MKCVKCEGTLRRVQLDDVEVDRCDTCAGICSIPASSTESSAGPRSKSSVPRPRTARATTPSGRAARDAEVKASSFRLQASRATSTSTRAPCAAASGSTPANSRFSVETGLCARWAPSFADSSVDKHCPSRRLGSQCRASSARRFDQKREATPIPD